MKGNRTTLTVIAPYRAARRLGTASLVSVLAFAWFVGAMAAAAPFKPSDDRTVIEELPSPASARARELQALRFAVDENPADLKAALHLARAYIQAARSDYDPRFNGYAEAVLQPWLTLETPPVDVLVLRATLRQSRHDFAGAVVDLLRALARAERHPQAWLTLAAVNLVQGDVEASLESCRRLRPLVDPLIYRACSSAAEALSGQARESRDRLESALNAASDPAPEVALWVAMILAEVSLALGDETAAEAHYLRAISLGRPGGYLLASYSDLLLDQGRGAEVLRLLEGRERADPLFLRIALAERQIGSARLADHIAALDARFEAARRRGDKLHLREEARFALELLDDPARALSLARENWRAQREPADARLLLEAARAAQRPAAARPVLDWLERTGLENARLEVLARDLRGEI